MSKVLVTGGVGFIGSHLCRALLVRGSSVRIVDDFSNAPYPAAQKERNAADLVAEYAGRVEIVRACVTHESALRPLFRDIDAVIHLAGLAGVRPSFADPARYARVNVEGTAQVAELARAHHIRRFVFASSSSIYGNSTPLPASESAPAVVPESPYAASKRGAELLITAMARKSPDTAYVGLRFFTVYGPRQRPEMAISSFMRDCLRGEPITLFGDGAMRRDFTHVDDIVRGVLATLDLAKPGVDIVNLGSGAPVDLNTLVRSIEIAAGRPLRVEHGPVPLGDVEATYADISRARNNYGWSPKIALADGLKTVVEWLESESVRSAPVSERTLRASA